jgi:Asp/Glu/hydantoin racemase
MKISVRNSRLISIITLKEDTQKAWNETVPPILCARLYSSTHSQLLNVISKRGIR